MKGWIKASILLLLFVTVARYAYVFGVRGPSPGDFADGYRRSSAVIMTSHLSWVLLDPRVDTYPERTRHDRRDYFEGFVAIGGKEQWVTYQKRGNGAFLGDMKIGDHDDIQYRSGRELLNRLSDVDAEVVHEKRAHIQGLWDKMFNPLRLSFAGVPVQTRLWPNGEVPYVLDRSVVDPVLKREILAGMRIWEAETGVRFRPARRNELALLIRSKVTDSFECWARLGYSPWKRKDGVRYAGEMFLAPACVRRSGGEVFRGTVLHEFGHVLGLMHEHQRPNRDQFLSLVVETPSQCEEEDDECWNAKANYGLLQTRYASPDYDLCSIMHYSEKPEETFSLTEEGRRSLSLCAAALPPGCRKVGQRCALSASDADVVRSAYQEEREARARSPRSARPASAAR